MGNQTSLGRAQAAKQITQLAPITVVQLIDKSAFSVDTKNKLLIAVPNPPRGRFIQDETPIVNEIAKILSQRDAGIQVQLDSELLKKIEVVYSEKIVNDIKKVLNPQRSAANVERTLRKAAELEAEACPEAGPAILAKMPPGMCKKPVGPMTGPPGGTIVVGQNPYSSQGGRRKRSKKSKKSRKQKKSRKHKKTRRHR